MTDRSEQIGVFGIGNLLMGDDGLGPHVVRQLEQRYRFPPQLVLRDQGTPGLSLLADIVELDSLLVIDAVRADAPPGSVHLYQRADLLQLAQPERLGCHDPGLQQALQLADLHGKCPRRLCLVGVVPAQVELRTTLSRQVAQAVPKVLNAVLHQLNAWGVHV